MKKISLEELRRDWDIDIDLGDDSLNLYADSKYSFSYDEIIEHKYLSNMAFNSYTKSLANLLHYEWDFIIEELEERISNYDKRTN